MTFEKLLVIGLIAALLIGPERLPTYAAALARLVKKVKAAIEGTKDRLKDELGDEYDAVDWKQLDPRQYDPRRIIRDALADSTPASGGAKAAGAAGVTVAAGAGEAGADGASDAEGADDALEKGAAKRESAYAQRKRRLEGKEPAPFDSEAT